MTLTKRLLRYICIFIITFMVVIPYISVKSAHALTDNTKEEYVTKSLTWLRTVQNSDGSFGMTNTNFLDTSEVAWYLKENNVLSENLDKAVQWMEKLRYNNNDLRARNLFFLDVNKRDLLFEELIKSQNNDGGLG